MEGGRRDEGSYRGPQRGGQGDTPHVALRALYGCKVRLARARLAQWWVRLRQKRIVRQRQP